MRMMTKEAEERVEGTKMSAAVGFGVEGNSETARAKVPDTTRTVADPEEKILKERWVAEA